MEYVVKEDIEEIAANGAEFLEKLLGKEVLITGAAGFFGSILYGGF